MPVIETRTMENNNRKRSNAFSIESIIGKESKRISPSPSERSRSPSLSPPRDRRQNTIITPNIYRNSTNINLHASRTAPFSDLANLEYQRSLATLGLINQSIPQPLPPSVTLLPGYTPQIQHHSPSPYHPAFIGGHPRDAHLFPWLLGRSEHMFGPRFTGHEAGLLLQPFRKSKRIRTAFSPSQLLKLEQSFDKNHYVVGQERKELANKLTLTETQVKVWFQNRRTKYKRLKYEEGEDRSPLPGTSRSPQSPDHETEELEIVGNYADTGDYSENENETSSILDCTVESVTENERLFNINNIHDDSTKKQCESKDEGDITVNGDVNMTDQKEIKIRRDEYITDHLPNQHTDVNILTNGTLDRYNALSRIAHQ